MFTLGVPVLGICYGCQLLAHHLGGRVTPAGGLFTGIRQDQDLLRRQLSPVPGPARRGHLLDRHGDYIAQVARRVPADRSLGCLPQCGHSRQARGFYGVQFHPPCHHTEMGTRMILATSSTRSAAPPALRTMADYKQTAIQQIHREGGQRQSPAGPQRRRGQLGLCRTAGGSHRQPADLCICGPRPDAPAWGDEVENAFARWTMNFVRVNAEQRFLDKLSGALLTRSAKRRDHWWGWSTGSSRASQEDRAVDYLASGHHLPDVSWSYSLGDAAVIEEPPRERRRPADYVA